eukprot:jgi/Botrbrau1/2128/Bobra.0093s0035.1
MRDILGVLDQARAWEHQGLIRQREGRGSAASPGTTPVAPPNQTPPNRTPPDQACPNQAGALVLPGEAPGWARQATVSGGGTVPRPAPGSLTSQPSPERPLPTSERRAALVFIHGFNCSLMDGCKGIGQFMALAGLPDWIRPFVFSWPTGGLVMYLDAKVKGAEAAATSQAFVDFIRGLGEAGFSDIHVMTHSMGVRVLMAALSLLEGLFRPSASSPGVASSLEGGPIPQDRLGYRLASVLLLNPDYSLQKFVGGQGQRLRALCPLVTIYGDQRDLALWGAAIFNGFQAAALQAAQGKANGLIALARAFRMQPSLGRHIYEIVDSQGRPLDVDIIDTTFLDANVQEARHFSFNLNSSLIDDLREILLHGRRAWERTSGLDSRGANVYSFLVAPTYIKNK